MSESNNVKFVENNGKWMWKRYDAEGSVIYRSPLFDTEREAREDYDASGEKSQESNEASNTSSEFESSAGTAAPEGDTSAGSASTDQGSTV